MSTRLFVAAYFLMFAFTMAALVMMLTGGEGVVQLACTCCAVALAVVVWQYGRHMA